MGAAQHDLMAMAQAHSGRHHDAAAPSSAPSTILRRAEVPRDREDTLAGSTACGEAQPYRPRQYPIGGSGESAPGPGAEASAAARRALATGSPGAPATPRRSG